MCKKKKVPVTFKKKKVQLCFVFKIIIKNKNIIYNKMLKKYILFFQIWIFSTELAVVRIFALFLNSI